MKPFVCVIMLVLAGVTTTAPKISTRITVVPTAITGAPRSRARAIASQNWNPRNSRSEISLQTAP